MTRVMGITLLLMTLSIAYIMLGMSSPSVVPVLVVLGIIFLEIIIFSILIHKAK